LRLIDGVSAATLQAVTGLGGSAAGAPSSPAGGGCPEGAGTFTVHVNFEPLPTGSTVSSTPSKSVASDSSSKPPSGGAR
jgi:hypothetical protein